MASSDYYCRLITTQTQWESLRPVWNRLLSASPTSTPWQSWEHLNIWWRRCAGTNRKLNIVLVEQSGEPCLALPLQLTETRLNILPMRILEPIGMLGDVNRPRFAIGAGNQDAYEHALKFLWDSQRDWDVIRSDEAIAGDRDLSLLTAFARTHQLSYYRRRSQTCPHLNLAQSWPSYLASRNPRIRKNLKRITKKLESLGAIEPRSYESPAEISVGLELMLQVYQRSWKHQEKIGLSQSDTYRQYYEEWLRDMAARGCARILVLFCGDRPVAATTAVMDQKTYYSTDIVYDNEFANFSPGTLLESIELEGLMKQGTYAEYDFLGGALMNKRRWTDTSRRTFEIYVFRNTPLNKLIELAIFWLRPRMEWIVAKVLRRKPESSDD